MTMQWWQETSIYQIYPRSFADSNGDGIGDLRGIMNNLDYICDLGFETIWLSPHYVSPQADFGYDIADFRDVAPEYGTLADAQELIDQVHRRDMKIVFDMILNHTSDQHPWFLESRASRENPRRDWYIWRDGRAPNRPPNNWKAIPGGSGWEYDLLTDQYFFHNFLPCQPDLNWRNPAVKAEMLDTLRFWLDRGVDGFRLDIFHAIYKGAQFRDNPRSLRFLPSADFDEGYFQKLQYNLNQPETFALAKEVRRLVDSYQPSRFVIGEVFGKNVVKRYLGTNHDGLHLILQFDLMENTPTTAGAIKTILQRNETDFPPPYVPTYALGNHDRRRFMSRIGGDEQLARLLTIFLYTIRGIPINYYGDEIGMLDGEFPHSGALDSLARPFWWLPVWLARRLKLYINRDGCRTPMQWNGTPHAGFTTNAAKPWLPVHTDFRRSNVAQQRKTTFSLLNTHRALLKLRKQHLALRRGKTTLHELGEKYPEIISFSREYAADRLLIILSFAADTQQIPLPEEFRGGLLLSAARAAVRGNTAVLPPKSALILGSPT